MDYDIDRAYNSRISRFEKDRKHSKMKEAYVAEKRKVGAVMETHHKFVNSSPEVVIGEDDVRRGDKRGIYEATQWIARSDVYRKNGVVGNALRSLSEAEEVLKKHSDLSDEEKKRIAQSIAERAYRIFLSSEDDRGATQGSYNILKEVQREWKVSPKKRNLEAHVSAVISILSFGGGLFFIIPNINGNVVAQGVVQNYSLVGAGLFLLGFVSAWLFLRFRFRKDKTLCRPFKQD